MRKAFTLLVVAFLVLMLCMSISLGFNANPQQLGAHSANQSVTVPPSLALLGGGAKWAAGNGSNVLFVDWEDNYLAHRNTDGANWGPWPAEADMINQTFSVGYILNSTGLSVTFAGDIPENFTGYDLVVINAYWAVEPRHCQLIQDYIAYGGGVVVLSGVPEFFRCYCKDWWTYTCPTDPAAVEMDEWLGCDGNYFNTGGNAFVTVDYPFGTALKSGDPLFTRARGYSNAGIMDPHAGSTIVAAWADNVTFAYTYTYYQGRVYFQASYDCLVTGAPPPPPPPPPEPINYTLAISVVSCDGSPLPPGCVTDPAAGSYLYEQGQTATVTATASEGWYFDHWTLDDINRTENPTSVKLTSDHILVAVFNPTPAPPPPPPPPAAFTVVYIDPSNVSNVAVGSTFIVEAYVFNVTDLFTWQVQIQFNASELNYVQAIYPSSGYIFSGEPQIPVAPIIDNVSGTIVFGASLLGSGKTSGNGGLCEITFKVMALGESSIDFSQPYGAQTFLLNGNLEIIPATLQNSSFSNDPPIGDVTGANGVSDGIVDMRDVELVARKFGELVPPASPILDLNHDAKIDMHDLGMVARNFRI